ncbi:hypothetical protein [Chryseolinea lacunae]|uniref:Uncharacterized protein n=1 Tax=Chryseolinea lacunae TaxID=2801331 RepID=A0ABS1KTX6_9BACT|nr:hypothetical protein [Chryseolinea lacunae]MBL0742692.1 hypothetical protein [Chryseolinea lacunae]
METKFREGEIVIERTRPTNKLIIMRCEDGLYYCKTQEGGRRKELVYFERELRSAVTFQDSTRV